ncbi:MAG: ABC transporter ATP-binding protein [Candidatus Magasanikbacteria bacterium]|nr:ABC transporter ATP-binding protein [Candidatus Magasanikbacteria bacterium]
MLYKLLGLYRRAFAPLRFRILGMVVLGFFSGIFEGVGINAIIPIFAFIDRSSTNPADSVSQFIIKLFGWMHLRYTLRHLLIFIAVLFIIKTVLSLCSQFLSISTSAGYEKQLRGELFKRTLAGNWPYLAKQKVGYLDQLLVTDIKQTSWFIVQIPVVVIMLTNLLVYSFLAINISVTIAALALIFGAVMFLFFKPIFYKNKVASAEVVNKYKEVAHFASENIIGIKIIKAHAAEQSVGAKAGEYFERVRQLRVRLELLNASTNILFQPVAFLFILAIFSFFYKTSTFNFSSFAVIVYAINKVFANIQQAQAHAQNISAQLPYMQSVLAYQEALNHNQEVDVGHNAFAFKNTLEFREVSFSHDVKPLLKGFNLTIHQGELVGLVGPSGAGKTTVVDLLLRLLQTSRGGIFLDGLDISQISLRSWREHVGYVAQEPFMVNDTIYNNVTFFDSHITKADVQESCRAAHCLNFIEELPERFNTIVGERGTRLSGGQRQRIALARVLARKPQILVLDEATSALDNESELLIQKAIEELRGKLTVIAIAHRLTTLAAFNRIAVLDQGRVVEEGHPQALLNDPKSYFARLYYLRSMSETIK